MSKSRFLVTGATGYLASWIITYLLSNGHFVRGSVRNVKKKEKYRHHLDTAEEFNVVFEPYEADLLNMGAFNDAAKDVDFIIHTASPFIVSNIKNAQEQLIKPALEGTRNVLEAANLSPSVKRVVLTSSVAAIYGDTCEANQLKKRTFDESHWNTSSSTDHQPYSYSKVVAEQEAWHIAEKQDKWTLAVINPSFIMGPSRTLHSNSESILWMEGLIKGKFKFGLPKMYNGVVDVREAARAHIEACFNEDIKGRTIVSSRVLSMPEMASFLKKEIHGDYPWPIMTSPKWLAWLMAPLFGLSRSFISRNVGFRFKLNNSKSEQLFKFHYRPVEQTLLDHFEQMQDWYVKNGKKGKKRKANTESSLLKLM